VRCRAGLLALTLGWAVPGSPAVQTADPIARAAQAPFTDDFDRLLEELDGFLRARSAEATSPGRVRVDARRFREGRLGRLAREGSLPPDARERLERIVDRHAARATKIPPPSLQAPIPSRGEASAAARPTTPQVANGTLSGRVTSAATGAGIPGAPVNLYFFVAGPGGWWSWRSTLTDASGNYAVVASPGTYYVKTANTAGYIDEAWNDVRCPGSCNPIYSAAASVTVTSGATTANIDFALDPGGRVAGTVVAAASSAPVAGAQVTIYDGNDDWVTSARTDVAGAYVSDAGLLSGVYYALVWTSGFSSQLYDGEPAGWASGGTPITVTAPATTSGIRFELHPGASLAGKVTEAGSGWGLPGVRVRVLSTSGDPVFEIDTQDDGSWSGGGYLPPGAYTVGTINFDGYLDQMWNGIPCPGGAYWYCGGLGLATPIELVAGTRRNGIDIALERGGRIAGRVTDASNGAGIPALPVYVHAEDGRFLVSGYTTSSGDYLTDTGLPSGRYLVRAANQENASPGGVAYVSQLYRDRPALGNWDLALGTPVTVTSGATTSGIDFVLERGGTLAGQVTKKLGGAAISGMQIDVLSESGETVASAESDGGGLYSGLSDGLPSGRYFARTGELVPEWGSRERYVEQVFEGLPCVACRPERVGTPILVGAGTATPGIDFALEDGGTLAGTVTSAVDHLGIQGFVSVHTPSGQIVKSGSTDRGRFLLQGLAPGSYRARTNTQHGFVDQVYGGPPCVGAQCDLAGGTSVRIAAGATTTIDFSLAPGVRLSGRVTDAATGLGLSGVRIQALKTASGPAAWPARTDGRGFFRTKAGEDYQGLPPGSYYLRTSNSQGYVDEVFKDVPCLACDVTIGTKVQVNAGTATNGLDFALSRGGRIGGSVTRAKGAPVALATVRFYDAAGRLVSTVSTGFTGAYLSQGLPAGLYYAAASSGTAGEVDALYDGAPFCQGCSPTAGTPVTVTTGATTGGIDILLESGGRISGRVSDAATGDPAFEGVVRVYNALGGLEREASVDAHGDYQANGLRPGTYFAVAEVGGRGYLRQLYGGLPCAACAPTSGTPIAVTSRRPVSGIDFALLRGGRIEGTVTRASDAQPLVASVEIYDAVGTRVDQTTTDAAGAYRASSGLATGSYYVRAAEGSGTYEDELWNGVACNACDPATGTAVAVTAPAVTAGIDFSLDTRALDFHTVVPCRVVDTRLVPSATGGPAVAAAEDRVVSLLAACGIPQGARSVSVNITATDATGPGHLRLHAAGSPVPVASSINYAAGQTRANNAIVPLSRFGELAVYCGQATGSVHFVLDVNGYFR